MLHLSNEKKPDDVIQSASCVCKKKLKESAIAGHVVENGHGIEESEHIIELIKCVKNRANSMHMQVIVS